MKPVLTADQVRAAEQAHWDLHPDDDLMARAAAGVAGAARRLLADHPTPNERPIVVVAAGGGNNAGDALFAAADLADEGSDVCLWIVSDKTHPAGLTAALRAGAHLVSRAEALDALPDADLVLDGVFGIGGRAGLPDSVAAFAAACRDHDARVLAVDVPSGLAADGVAPGDAASFAAEATVTFIAEKLCHVATPAAERCGRVELVDIGVDAARAQVFRVEESDLAQWYPWPGAEAQKYSRGVVGLDTGSPGYPGAAMLGTAGALFAGTGMIRYAGPESVAGPVVQHWPSVVPGEGRVQAWVCGSGWDEPDAERLARRVGDGVPMVLDAGALEVLPDELPEGCLLTPHAGELARLLGVEREAVEDDPLALARRAAQQTGATVLLKGATQYVARPGGEVLVAVRGPAWTGQAGSGDVLGGACGAMLAAGLPAHHAAALAASLQALTAMAHPGPIPPDRLAAHFPETIVGWR